MMKIFHYPRPFHMLTMAAMIMASASFASATLLPNDTCGPSSACPGGLIRGSSPVTSVPADSFIILEDFGIPQPLIDPTTLTSINVVSGDVLVYDDVAGTILSDILRFPDTGTPGHPSGVANYAILYSSDETGAGGIPLDRQSTLVSIKEKRGPSTLYKSIYQGEVDYTIASPSAVPEPGTFSLFGISAMLLILTSVFRRNAMGSYLMKRLR